LPSYRFDYNFLHKTPTEYIRKVNVNRGQWSEENLGETVRRLQANKISFTKAERYYGIPERTSKKEDWNQEI
jgi:hypothetical protein